MQKHLTAKEKNDIFCIIKKMENCKIMNKEDEKLSFYQKANLAIKASITNKATEEEKQQKLLDEFCEKIKKLEKIIDKFSYSICTHCVKSTNPSSKNPDVVMDLNYESKYLGTHSIINKVNANSENDENIELINKFDISVAAQFATAHSFLLKTISIEEKDYYIHEFITLDKKQQKEVFYNVFSKNETENEHILNIIKQIFKKSCEVFKDKELTLNDSLNKQILWNVDEDNDVYHNLIIMYPALLTNELYDKYMKVLLKNKKDREKNQKLENEEPKECEEQQELKTTSIIKNIAKIKNGGTNPINVSILTNRRNGYDYLLSTIPPIFCEEKRTLKTESFFNNELTTLLENENKLEEFKKTLINLFKKQTYELRKGKEEKLTQIIDEALSLANFYQQKEEGWTDGLRLNKYEKIWLDKGKESEKEENPLWKEEVAKRFSHFLMHKIQKEVNLVDNNEMFIEIKHKFLEKMN